MPRLSVAVEIMLLFSYLEIEEKSLENLRLQFHIPEETKHIQMKIDDKRG